MDANTIGNLGGVAVQNAQSNKAEQAIVGAFSKDAAQRQKVAQEFASFLYLEVLKAMRAALPEKGLLETEAASRDMYTSMMDAELARLMAKRDTTGLSKMVQKSLDKMTDKTQKQNQPVEPAPGVISSSFGFRQDPIDGTTRFHDGVDIAAPTGSPVKAAASGKVIFSGNMAGYGNMVEVDHGNGIVTRYGHNSLNLVAAGDEVQGGQAIALVGNTGRSTGSHLHFEVRKAGKAVNPSILLGEFAKGTRHSSSA
ncbi:MAG TPA: peptidoglycan DD-metalloendopeptidase family protein [Methylomirabilota bacterium]|nr:peptidoglycan DD-metalloendopeptidase family protein [Methylomirabilota bacterium]